TKRAVTGGRKRSSAAAGTSKLKRLILMTVLSTWQKEYNHHWKPERKRYQKHQLRICHRRCGELGPDGTKSMKGIGTLVWIMDVFCSLRSPLRLCNCCC
ncbi:hypothetical protein Tco_0929605, partial [Tanacetum coccineum]